MIHWAPLSMKFLVRMTPLLSAEKWFPIFAVFRKLVLPSHTLFYAIEVAGHWRFTEISFHAQTTVEFLLPVFYLPLRTRGTVQSSELRSWWISIQVGSHRKHMWTLEGPERHLPFEIHVSTLSRATLIKNPWGNLLKQHLYQTSSLVVARTP